MRESIGLNDREGKPIHIDDIVEFYFCADHGSSIDENQCDGDVECFPTKMVDKVVKLNDKFYFESPGIGLCYPWRYNIFCKIIGRLPEDEEMFLKENDVFTAMIEYLSGH